MWNRGALLGGLAIVATLALVLALKASGKDGAAGFFGPGPLLSDINLVVEIALAAGLTIGMLLARTGNIEAHRRNQTTWVLVNLVFVGFLMAGSIATFKFNGIADLRSPGVLVTYIHATVGTLTVLAGLWLVLQMHNLIPAVWHLRRWKGLMRATLAGYWIVALLGIATYRAWYSD
jgi:uncharacterized membrane protein YozB (DUF420 family)